MSFVPSTMSMRTRPPRLGAFLVGILFAGPALAYVDPGTGMLLIQGIVAAVGAVAIVVGRPFRWLSRKWKSLRRRDEGS